MITHILIDGDPLVYRYGSSSETKVDWGDDEEPSRFSNEELAKAEIDLFIESLKEKLKADKVSVALSCPTQDGFRRQLLPTYKANRAGAVKPLLYETLREYLLTKYSAKLVEPLEADDILGIMATKPSKEKRIVCSIDKDFLTVPCWFYNWNQETLVKTTEDEANYFWMIQTLAGDSVDGFKGIPRVGPKRAQKFLEESEDDPEVSKLWSIVVQAFESKGMTQEDALVNARMARILRYGDYDFGSKEVKLWTIKEEM